jgi:paraquat-inducible protein A
VPDPGILLVCEECDSLQRTPELRPGGVARCLRCGARLAANPRGGIDTPLALAVGAAILFLVANAFPLVELQIQGRAQATSLSGAALALVRDGSPALGVVVWLTSVLAPGLTIGITLYVLAAVRWMRPLPLVRPLLAWLSRFRPWGMLDVFMLGILVAMVKLGGVAEIVLGPGLYAFVPLLLFTAGAASTLETRCLWERLEHMP